MSVNNRGMVLSIKIRVRGYHEPVAFKWMAIRK